MVRVRIGDREEELSWEAFELLVRAGRVPPNAKVCFEPVTGESFVLADQLELYNSLRNEAALEWEGQFRHSPPPLLTALLVGVQIRIYWLAQVPEIGNVFERLFTNWTAPALEDIQPWRIVTMGFLHMGFFHIFLNMVWLAYVGWGLERALGRANLAILYLSAVIGGSLLSMFGAPATPSLGASGGIFGLIAASVVFGFLRPDALPERGRKLFGVALLPYLVLMFISGLSNPGTDNFAHFGGLVTGGVLAFFLDPEPLQRRPGWNQRVRWALGLSMIAIVVGLGALGPRLSPLESAQPRHLPRVKPGDLPAEPSYSALQWTAPSGWRRGVNPAGDPAFRSPHTHRSWAVVLQRQEQPLSVDSLRQQWLEKLARGWPQATVGDPEDVEVVGQPGQQIRVQLGTEVLQWRGTTRGLFGYYEVWDVDARSERWLTPLRDRLRARVVWGDSEALHDARNTLAYLPNSVRSQQAMAQALGEAGRVDAADRIWVALIAAHPTNTSYWEGRLQLARWYPDAFDDTLLNAALAANTPATTVAVAHTLEAWERSEQARGLLELAWSRWPGDRAVRKGRKRSGLPTAISPQGRPWFTVFDPLNWHPADRPLPSELSLDTAARVGAALSAERTSLTTKALKRPADLDTVRALLALSIGHPPSNPTKALTRLRAQVQSAVAGGPPSWMPTDVAESLHNDEALTAVIDALLSNPDQLTSALGG